MMTYIFILGLVLILMLVLYFVFRASAIANRGREESVTLYILQMVVGVLSLNQGAHLVTVWALFTAHPVVSVWLPVGGVLAVVEAIALTLIMFELLGGSIRRKLFDLWECIGDYLKRG